jgi:phosphatidate phosphatase APP1
MRLAGPALVAVLVCACRSSETVEARLQALDALARPGEEITLCARLEREGVKGIHPDIAGAPLVYVLEGRRIGRAVTDDDGTAELRWRAPAGGRADLRVEVRTEEGSGYAAAPSTLLVAVRDGARPILITDIDHTIADIASLKFPFEEPEDIPERPGAARVLRSLAERYDIVYLTARDDAYVERTRRWLAIRGFPAGPVFHRDLTLTRLSAGDFKTGFLRGLKKAWPGCRVGVGDRTEDVEAYRGAGLEAILIGDDDLPEGARRAASWADIEEFLADGPRR